MGVSDEARLSPLRSSSDYGPVVLAWRRFGPYHHARARAAALSVPLVGLEISNVDRINAWQEVLGDSGFHKITLFNDSDVHVLNPSVLRKRLEAVLNKLMPRVIVVHGYASRDALALLDWAVRHECPTVIMSDSNAGTGARGSLQETVKSRIVRLFGAGFVSGTLAQHYLVKLGIPMKRVLVGYDVVDNSHFSRCKWNLDFSLMGITTPFFLASSRFIELKNLSRLLEAYSLYRQKTGDGAWALVILGDGELRNKLEVRRAVLGLDPFVHFPGYIQYEELPQWYGAAACFIHPSKTETWALVVNEAMAAGLPVLVSDRCGCTPELVQNGVNGFTFDPYDVGAIASVMNRMSHGVLDPQAMGHASTRIIAEWGPERFADGLSRAVDAALLEGPPKATLLDKALLGALIRR